MTKHFIDLGGHNGSSARLFRKKHDPKCEWKITSFEPLISYIPDIEYPKINCELIEAAAWIYTGKVPMYVSRTRLVDGSTTDIRKTTGELNYDKAVIVPSIDFAAFLKNRFAEKDCVVVKMNIEGGEYPLITHLIDTKAIERIDLLVLQWHWWKLKMTADEQEIFASRINIPWRDLDKNYQDFGDMPC